MGEHDGQTGFGKGVITIDIKQSVHDDALLGVGRSRNTCAHELGHGVMHDGAIMARRAISNITPKWIRPFESAEHQAKVFAPAFLINDTVAETLQTPEEVSIEFGISLESAKIHYQQILESRDRKASEERVSRMAQDFRARTMAPPNAVRYLQELCTACGRQTLLPLGIKFMCVTCDTVFDRFQDGDSVE
jgi:Zn-dependent peptidase ImmA (M78 family)